MNEPHTTREMRERAAKILLLLAWMVFILGAWGILTYLGKSFHA